MNRRVILYVGMAVLTSLVIFNFYKMFSGVKGAMQHRYSLVDSMVPPSYKHLFKDSVHGQTSYSKTLLPVSWLNHKDSFDILLIPFAGLSTDSITIKRKSNIRQDYDVGYTGAATGNLEHLALASKLPPIHSLVVNIAGKSIKQKRLEKNALSLSLELNKLSISFNHGKETNIFLDRRDYYSFNWLNANILFLQKEGVTYFIVLTAMNNKSEVTENTLRRLINY